MYMYNHFNFFFRFYINKSKKYICGNLYTPAIMHDTAQACVCWL